MSNIENELVESIVFDLVGNIVSPIGDIPLPKPIRWIVSGNVFVIADTNGRIITAGR